MDILCKNLMLVLGCSVINQSEESIGLKLYGSDSRLTLKTQFIVESLPKSLHDAINELLLHR